jgi:hypothetical protein
MMFFDESFEAPVEEFPLGVTMVHACFEYWNMSPDLRISGYAYHNGENWGNISGFMDFEGNDFHCFTLSVGGGRVRLDPGKYKVTLFINNDQATEGEFKILR